MKRFSSQERIGISCVAAVTLLLCGLPFLVSKCDHEEEMPVIKYVEYADTVKVASGDRQHSRSRHTKDSATESEKRSKWKSKSNKSKSKSASRQQATPVRNLRSDTIPRK